MLSIDQAMEQLPHQPGVYRFYDAEQKVIYVGKAKDLKKRVSSYFQKEHESVRLKALVRKIHHIDYVIVDNEWEALLLENSFIKAFQPRYNINLKDDKSYPWVVITKEPFPRIILTRHHEKYKGEKIGPFANVTILRNIMELCRDIFHIRTCRLDLSPEKIQRKIYRPCLEYHIGKCKAPCIAMQNEKEYEEEIAAARHILRGHIKDALIYLKNKMQEVAHKWLFEKAHEYKIKIEQLKNFSTKNAVVSADLGNLDVLTYITEGTLYFFNYMVVENGAVIQSHNIKVEKQIETEDEYEIMLQVLTECRCRFGSSAREILVEKMPADFHLTDFRLIIPKQGEKKELIDLSLKNARRFYIDWLSSKLKSEKARKVPEVLIKMKEELRLPTVPLHIECFDNSNIQGYFPVSSCVVFKYGKPAKKEYRHFNVKTVSGPDDFSTMQEVVYRRYRRLLDEQQPLPDLIIIDGGKGQLNAALAILDQLNLRHKVSIISIAKKLEEIFYPEDPYPLYLNKRSPVLTLLQQIRNEAHRFAISHHRHRRDVKSIASELKNIQGIGNATITKLLSHFGSLEQIKQADEASLTQVVSKRIAQRIMAYFQQKHHST